MKHSGTTPKLKVGNPITDMVEHIDANFVRRIFRGRYGRGWQGRLARNIGVADSTLSGWLKTDDFPQWAKLGISALVTSERPTDAPRWHVIRRDGNFEICSLEQGTGRVVARGIERIEDAYLIAAAPGLFEACNDVAPMFRDAVESDIFVDMWSEPSVILNAAIEAAKPPSTTHGEVARTHGTGERAEQ